jgi:fatty acid-binding protein DegV
VTQLKAVINGNIIESTAQEYEKLLTKLDIHIHNLQVGIEGSQTS